MLGEVFDELLFLVSTKSLLIIGVIVIIFSGVVVGLIVNLQPVNRLAGEIEFIVNPGDSLKVISIGLYQSGLIRSQRAFQLFSLFSGLAHQLKPGYYRVSPASSTSRITYLLVAGPKITTVTIHEGETLKDIDQKLSGLGIIREGELISFSWQHLREHYTFLEGADSLEGFLFPDTYRFAQFSPVDIIAKEFLNNFKTRAWPLLAKSDKNYYNTLIVASLLEKETPFSRDRAVVAGIIYKRIRLGMPLQIDATTAYEKCDQRFVTCPAETRVIYRSDLKEGGPFNTYRNLGLPPTPIASPGVTAIKAALNPIASSYLFYISDLRSGKAIFASSLDEHNNNRVKYLNL